MGLVYLFQTHFRLVMSKSVNIYNFRVQKRYFLHDREGDLAGRRGRRVGYPRDVQNDTKKRELLENPTKIEEIQEKKIIYRN